MSKAASNLVSNIIMKDIKVVKNGVNHGSQSSVSNQPDNTELQEVTKSAKYWVDQLCLQQHPFMEEAYFRETFIDPQMVEVKKDSKGDNKLTGGIEATRLKRSASTLIYYLHLPVDALGDSTLFYRSRCSSISMHFYQGLPISLYYFAEEGKLTNDSNEMGDTIDEKQRKNSITGTLKLRKVTLGPGGPEKGQMFHATITKNTWFTRILEKDEALETKPKVRFEGDCLNTLNYSLVGVSVAPGFDYNDLRTAPYGCLLEI